jgi:predicted metal-dependent hydrolase
MFQIIVSDIVIDIVRKAVKHLRLTIYPTGKVHLAAPLKMPEKTIQTFALSKVPWIKKHKKKFDNYTPPPTLEYISGETHYYQGTGYLLNVIEKKGTGMAVMRDDLSIDLYVRENSDLAQRQRVMTAWYRQQMKEQIIPLIDKWQAIIGVKITECGIKQMKTKWGTCNIRVRRIWLNLDLIKKPIHCLEYVIVHELVHLLERRHNARFKHYMDKFMPEWRHYKADLNRLPV